MRFLFDSRRTLGLISKFYTNGGRWVNKSHCQRNAQNKTMEVCIIIHERKGGHFRRQYSAQAKTATGYAIAAMRMAELPPDTIQQVVGEMRVMIDKYSLGEAAQIATSSPY